jgi:2-polyprenyl-3-methyl-5-hydroxy-6-metoxy-1,4-benzoquinol methylase
MMTKQELSGRAWPSDGLEAVPECPVCGAPKRILLYDDLWDGSFQVAPGTWSLWRCGKCRSAYLDPRPTPQTIGLAYESYYTHASEAEKDEGVAPANPSMRVRLTNKVRSLLYGGEGKMRFLRRPDGEHPKVLDLGCGSGDWLVKARAAGWMPYGSDPDPNAVLTAQRQGLEVRQGGVEAWQDVNSFFDAVTMSHVIEHVHDPRQVLAAVLKLLRPGGQLFIETPNIDSLSHAAFGGNWRGLETPRHLLLFNRASLDQVLRQVGFTAIRHHRIASPVGYLVSESKRIASASGAAPGSGKFGELALKIRAQAAGSRSEFLTLTCERPR